jgi:uncharacterized lipoprotein YbaY
MVVIVDIGIDGDRRPPVGSPVRVEVRDTSLADAPSITVGAAEGQVRGQLGSWLETVEVETQDLPPQSTVWVLVDVDRDGRVSRGDFVTTESYPVPRAAEPRVSVRVRPV